MKRLGVLLLVLTILLSGAQPQVAVSNMDRTVLKRINVPLLAVTSGNEGSVINVTIEALYPGSGNIIINDEDGDVGNDTIISVRYALILASILTRIDYRSLDYRVVFPKNTLIEGTSATLDFLIAFTSILTGESASGVGATGLVAPSLVIGNVSRIPVKYKAGVGQGLRIIAGPYYPLMNNYSRYHGEIDVLHLFTYLNLSVPHPLPGLNLLENNDLRSVFNYSYSAFKHNLSKIIQRQPQAADIREYFLAEKYRGSHYEYTAASYMFRAFIKIAKSYYQSLFMRRGRIIVALLTRWFHGNASIYENMLKGLDRKNTTLNPCSLDALINSYIRYRIARDLYDLASNSTNTTETIDLLTTGIARLHTARHWLRLAYIFSKYGSNNHHINNWFFNQFYIETLRYFESMNYIPRIRIPSYNDTLKTLLEMYYNWYILGVELESLKPPVFHIPREASAVKRLNETLNSLSLMLQQDTGEMIPSALTSLEIGGRYLSEKEDMSVISSILFSELMIITLEYSLWFNTVNPFNNLLLIAEHGIHTMPSYVGLLEWASIVITGIGALLIGWSVCPRSRLEESLGSMDYSCYPSGTHGGGRLEFGNPPPGEASASDNTRQRPDDKLQ